MAVRTWWRGDDMLDREQSMPVRPVASGLTFRDLCLIALAVFIGLWLFALTVVAIVSIGVHDTHINVTTSSQSAN